MVNKIARLVQKVNKETGKKEWVLTSRSKPYRVLKWFGSEKPSKEKVLKEEKRIWWFKAHGEEIIDKLHKISGKIYGNGLIHIADSLVNCIEYLVKGESLNECSIKLSKIISILEKKGEVNSANRLLNILPEILGFEDAVLFKTCEFNVKPINNISAKRAYNIYKLYREKYQKGEILPEDIEYKRMGELELLLKSGFILPLPSSYKEIPTNENSWWDHFNK
jgi:hypothetical protein